MFQKSYLSRQPESGRQTQRAETKNKREENGQCIMDPLFKETPAFSVAIKRAWVRRTMPAVKRGKGRRMVFDEKSAHLLGRDFFPEPGPN